MSSCKCTSSKCSHHNGRCGKQILHHDGKYCSGCRSRKSSGSSDDGLGGLGVGGV